MNLGDTTSSSATDTVHVAQVSGIGFSPKQLT